MCRLTYIVSAVRARSALELSPLTGYSSSTSITTIYQVYWVFATVQKI
jgi:hypothetical protein